MNLLAIDIGASSGRHIFFREEEGKLIPSEVYRFTTPFYTKDGRDYWDVEELFHEVLAGLKMAAKAGLFPERIGIDTFGVDYALLNEKGERIAPVASYRDERTRLAKKEFLDPTTIFSESGIQPQSFDTVYQLASDKKDGLLSQAHSLLMLPSYLAYRLTGVKQNERSILSTSALYDGRTNDYSPRLLEALGISQDLFPPLLEAGTPIGPFQKEIAETLGFQSTVYASLEHDTAAAFFASGAKEDEVLISSGTWSLLGSILPKPIVNEAVYQAGFTNELSHRGEVRFLKNVTGMWMVNRLMKESPSHLAITQVVDLAREGSSYPGYFNATDERLLNPSSMKEAIYALLQEEKFSLPQNEKELFYAVFHSLAKSYALAITQMSELTGRKFHAIRIFGGGSKNELLNELTSFESRLPVFRGPIEATAYGNAKAILG